MNQVPSMLCRLDKTEGREKVMAKISAYSIGRSKDSDVQLSDPSISRLHAELVITAESKYYLTDCGSSAGTYTMQGNEKTAINQKYVEQLDNLCLGEFHTSVQQLVAMIDDPSGEKGKKIALAAKDDLPDGPVKRDPVSGEIIGDDN
jgi:predicted component of type VI protein secretion system